MKAPMAVDTKWVERKMDYLLTPSGLMTAVLLILLSTFVLRGNGIEHRTMDAPETAHNPATVSPILGNP